MRYTRTYECIAETSEKLQHFIKSKNIPGYIEMESVPMKGSGISGIPEVPTGWATLTVETSDELCQELNDFFRKMENESQL